MKKLNTKIEATTWLSTQLILQTIVHYYVNFVSIEILNFVVNYHLIKIEQEQYHLTHLNDTKITSKPYLQEKTHPIVKIMGLVAKKRKPPILENPCKDLKICCQGTQIQTGPSQIWVGDSFQGLQRTARLPPAVQLFQADVIPMAEMEKYATEVLERA